MQRKNKYILVGIITVGLIFWFSMAMVKEAEQERQKDIIRQQQKELSLKRVIDEENQTQVVDVLYALERLTENYSLSGYSFDAIKAPDEQGYIAVVKNVSSPSGSTTGNVLFWISKKALNQTEKSDLSKSIEAINGLAKDMAPSISFSKKYDYTKAMELF